MVRISISTRRAIDEIGTSFGPPSNGFEEFSPTFSSETKIQPTLLGIHLGFFAGIAGQVFNRYPRPDHPPYDGEAGEEDDE